MIRIVVADDHLIFRQGLLKLLQSAENIKVVGEASDGAAALALIKTEKPDIAVLDVSMPVMSGFEVISELIEEGNATKIIYLTMHDDLFTVKKVAGTQAAGFVSKEDAYEDLIYAIQAVSTGRKFISPSISDKILQLDILKDTENVLTGRELEVLNLIARGITNKKIAEQLSISVKTVETYRTRIMHKLDIQTTADIIKYAIKTGLLK